MINIITTFQQAIDGYVLQHGYPDIHFVVADSGGIWESHDVLDIEFQQTEISKIFDYYFGESSYGWGIDCNSSRGCAIFCTGDKVNFGISKSIENGLWSGTCSGTDIAGETLCESLKQTGKIN